MKIRHKLAAAAIALLAAGCAAPAQQWKGNLHTHSLWSDGADYPEMIVDWYRSRGYHFLALTEHDLLQSDGLWVDIDAPDAGWPPRNTSARRALPGYLERFGEEWVQQHAEGGRRLVRVRPIAEYRGLFERPGEFLLLTGEEITDRQGSHVNAFNLAAAILPQGGATARERIAANVAAVEAQRAAVGRASIFAIVNHPNFVWALAAEDLAGVPDARLFEVFNGHTMVNNAGDSLHADTDRIWDVALSLRHAAGLDPLFGVATDDAHDYREYGDTVSRPGRGWVMVRAPSLDADALGNAMRRGDFYATTGVTIRSERHDARGIRIEVEPEDGVSYRTYFIGTRSGASLEGIPVVTAAGDTLRTTRTYGDGVGEVLAAVDGTVAQYVYRGDERYARAKVVSSKLRTDVAAGHAAQRETAWLQPVFREVAR